MRPNTGRSWEYFSDLGVPEMSDEEKLSLAMWFHQGMSYWHQMRGVYWGNLISRGHLNKVGGQVYSIGLGLIEASHV